ncbi:hypothetical protein ACX12E_02100 [Paenibacillus vandeheii]
MLKEEERPGVFAKEGKLLAEKDLGDYRCLIVRGLGEEVLDYKKIADQLELFPRLDGMERAHESGHIRPFHGLLSFFIIGLNSKK